MSDTLHCRIGEAARRSGVSAANIRYYEKEGLLAPQGRSDNSYRFYGEADLHRLRFIRLCRAMDMALDEVHTLLALDGICLADGHVACATLDEHLAHVRTRLDELRVLEQELCLLRSCFDGVQAQCQVIDALHARAEAQDWAPQRNAPAHRHV